MAENHENQALSEFEETVRQAFDVPGADAAFVNRLRADLLSRTAQPRPQWGLRLAWAIALALVIIVLLISAPRIVSAVRQLFGYVPDIGLVDSSAGLRMLAQPASVTQGGVTLTVTQAMVYPDHVQIVFETSGIAPQDDIYQGADNQGNPTAFCGGVNIGEAPNQEGDPTLRLSDGTVIARVFGSDEYPDNIFYAKPAFKTRVPADVTEMTLVFKCIYGSRLGAVPENWEVPLKLVAAPAGSVVGTPVMEVETEPAAAAPTKNSQAAEPEINVRLEKVVAQADGYSFFFSLTAQPADENLIALYPASASLIDATGQKIALIYKRPWHPGEPVDLWELQTTAKPGYGPYTLIIDKIFAYYNTNNAVFDFDPGLNPQMGQSWPLDQTFAFGGQAVKVTSATIEKKDFTTWGLASDIPGITFTFQAVDGKTPIRLGILDNNAEHSQAGQVIPSGDGEPAPTYRAGLYYEKGMPAGKIPVSIYEASRLISGDWEFQWADPQQTGAMQLHPAEAVSSKPGIHDVTASLEKVVKLADGYLFYIHITSTEQRPNLITIEPITMYGIDSTGQKISLSLDAPQAYLAKPDTVWQYRTTGKIAEGPIQLVVEKALAHYAAIPLDTPPTQPVLEANTFTFEAGPAPAIGQTWTLNQPFAIGGYPGKVVSVRAVSFDPSQHPEIKDAQGYGHGYEFTVQSDDPADQMNVALEITPGVNEWVPTLKVDGKPGATSTQTIFFQGDLPNQQVKVTFSSLTVLLEDSWTIHWTPPKQ